ncbi:PD40 domain-containing protein [Mesonia sp. K7]|uniref:TolB family protein n=1 Tax=Mesonia sp. K7 TaxID=2218606 RepID=UPI000DAA1ED0|nr:PD40 domain-containing protein [Mesonia sp. K7]PZD78103.1 exo-alpha-sialidase [Mesonia sp. K7]
MLKQNLILICGFIFILSCNSPKNETQKEETTENNFQLATSTEEVKLFAEDIVSTSLYERDLAISPKGDEIVYTLGNYNQKKRSLVSIQKINEVWISPKLLSISGKYQDIEPFFDPSSNRLYFASNRPMNGDTTRADYNIWYSEKIAGVWNEPVALDPIINTRSDEFYPSLSKSGNLYFTATRGNGIGGEDIFMAQPENGQFSEPILLPETINTVFYEFNAFIDPEEKYLIFSSYGRADDLGGGDLYMSEKDSDGNWMSARHLGDQINSDKLDYCPFVDVNAKILYFTSERIDQEVSEIKSVEQLRALSNSIQNGFGNIYSISLEAVKSE